MGNPGKDRRKGNTSRHGTVARLTAKNRTSYRELLKDCTYLTYRKTHIYW
jgi:hypothetical protein